MLAFVLGANEVDFEAIGWVHYVQHAGVRELSVESAATVLWFVLPVGLLNLFDRFWFVYQILLNLLRFIHLQRIKQHIVPCDVMVVFLLAVGLGVRLMGVVVELVFVVIAKGTTGFFLIVLELQIFLVEVAHVLFAVLFGEGVVGILLQVVIGREIRSGLFGLLGDHDSFRSQSLFLLAELPRRQFF